MWYEEGVCESSYDLYEDDGFSNEYKKNVFTFVMIKMISDEK
ncbi:DUF5110 domain-containing protein [Clostridium grantii]